MKNIREFPPLSKSDLLPGEIPDFVFVSGDAYIDHPSFSTALIVRVLQDAGFSVAVLAQPDYKSAAAFREFGKPRLGFFVSAGNLDSMVAHYTVSKKKRTSDYYSPGGKAGLRPDRACIVYSNRVREAYGDVPLILGGLEASLRRCAHYDYWQNKMRRSILLDSRADMLIYGMGERSVVEVAKMLDRGVPVKKIHGIRGTAYLAKAGEEPEFESVGGFDYDEIKENGRIYAEAFRIQHAENDSVRGRAVTERYGDRTLVVNPPQPPLEREELDKVYALPFTRKVHPIYESEGGVPAIKEVAHSITHSRGCFGDCNFCAITFHQGKAVRSRSIESVVEEAKIITQMPDFKGYINDIGGPTANFRYPACDKQLKYGTCADRKCLAPRPCKQLKVDHSEYLKLISEVEKIDKIKKVFIRSGIRYDYLILDKDESFFRKLVRDNVSGQLKVAPENIVNSVLDAMGKPHIEEYEKFKKRFFEITAACGKEQYLVPYLMSSHPGGTLEDAVKLAVYLKENRYAPEQVQDFYPTPGTASTVMFATGIDPFTGKKVKTVTDYREKLMCRALLQYNRPENADLVREALQKTGHTELIGYGKGCLVRPGRGYAKKGYQNKKPVKNGNKKSGKKNNRRV